MRKFLEKVIVGYKTININRGKTTMRKHDIKILVTRDEKGISLSIASKADDVMYTIPIDEFSDELIYVFKNDAH